MVRALAGRGGVRPYVFLLQVVTITMCGAVLTLGGGLLHAPYLDALPEGVARRLPKGAVVELEIHYTPNGTKHEDLSAHRLSGLHLRLRESRLNLEAEFRALDLQFDAAEALGGLDLAGHEQTRDAMQSGGQS